MADEPIFDQFSRTAEWRDRETGLPNVREFLRDLEREASRTRRHGEPLVVVVLEPDGDLDPVELVRLAAKTVRREDVVARLGERRLGLILVAAPAHSGRLVAARLALAAAPHGTISVGLRTVAAQEADPDRARCYLADAVRALEEAQACGGDLVVAFEDVLDPPN